MTNPKVPTPIVDRNGKKTTVHRSADKPVNGKGRDLPFPLTHGVAKNSPVEKLQRAVKRSGLSDDTRKISKLVRHLGRAEGRSPADRYTGFVRLVSSTYDIERHAAKTAADRIYTALGFGDSIKETVHRDELNKAARKKLVENHKIRFPREGSVKTEDAVDYLEATKQLLESVDQSTIDSIDDTMKQHVKNTAPKPRVLSEEDRTLTAELHRRIKQTSDSQTNEEADENSASPVIVSVTDEYAELAEATRAITDVDADGKSMLVLVNAILNAEDKPRLEAVKSALDSHGIDLPVKDFYTIYSLATREGLSPAARTMAFRIILTENPDAVTMLDKNLAAL